MAQEVSATPVVAYKQSPLGLALKQMTDRNDPYANVEQLIEDSLQLMESFQILALYWTKRNQLTVDSQNPIEQGQRLKLAHAAECFKQALKVKSR